MIEAKNMVGPIVAVVLVMAVVCPIIAGMGVTSADLDNSTELYAAKDPASSLSMTIAFNADTGGATFTYGGETFEVPRLATLTLAAGGDFGFRYAASASSKIALYAGTSLTSGITSATFENGTITYTRDGGEPMTREITGDVWHIAKTGSYGVYNTFNANANSEVFVFFAAAHGPSGNTVNLNLSASGTPRSLEVSQAGIVNGSNVTSLTTVSAAYTETTGGVITVTALDVDYNGVEGSYSGAWFFAPVTYEMEGFDEDGGIVGTLVNIVPILLIVGIVISIVAGIMWKRD